MKSTSNSAVKQDDPGLHLSTWRSRQREFLDEMEHVVPWAELLALIAGYAPEGKRGRRPFALRAPLAQRISNAGTADLPQQTNFATNFATKHFDRQFFRLVEQRFDGLADQRKHHFRVSGEPMFSGSSR